MRQPVKYKERIPIEPLTGIKSSLQHLRSVVALSYLLYVANGRKSELIYANSDGAQGLILKESYLDFIAKYFNDDSVNNDIISNPLLTSQIESLYVGLTLMFGLGRISFDNKSFGMTKERTGGIRYPKKIEFASNMMLLDMILQGVNEESRKSFLRTWLRDQKIDSALEQRIALFLNIAIENNLFKIRDNGNDYFYQTEGIYLAFRGDDEVSILSDETVGPARILNSMLREDLIPWFTVKNSVIREKTDYPFDSYEYSKIITTSLDIKDIKVDNSDDSNQIIDEEKTAKQSYPSQIIYYGAPGTGKSFKVESEGSEDDRIRTTFHPDTDYSSFVGCYKPMEVGEGEDKHITYKFEGQCFAKAYVEAWKRLLEEQPRNYTLVIEEINRGNCAQIFGDIFQLLDRNDDGYSRYGIQPDEDLAAYLREEFEETEFPEEYAAIKNGTKMVLPPNLSIIATMNTSDQSLFPIDSAFKRRWDWEYIPIQYKPKDEKGNKIANKIEVNGAIYDWGTFIEAVNKRIEKLTHSEDKQLGYFFVRPAKGENITMKRFVSKVIFYLWSDIYKDYAGRNDSIFKFSEDGDEKNKTDHSFNSFFKDGEIKVSQVKSFIEQFEGVKDESNDDDEESGSKRNQYHVNGDGPFAGKELAFEAMKLYVNSNPNKTPQEIVNEWNTLGVSNSLVNNQTFVATTQFYRAKPVPCNGGSVWVTTYGWTFNPSPSCPTPTIPMLIQEINEKDWGINIEIIEP